MASFFICFIIYLFAWITAYFFRKTTIGKYLHFILSIPAAFILYAGDYAIALGAVLFTSAVVLMLSVYAFGIIPNKILGISINDATTLYLSLTFSSIIMTSFGDTLVNFWHYIQSPDERSKLSNLSTRILDQRKIRYVLFFCYFIVLLFLNYCVLNQIEIFLTPKMDTAILQAFATYVAYDRLASNWNAIMNTK